MMINYFRLTDVSKSVLVLIIWVFGISAFGQYSPPSSNSYPWSYTYCGVPGEIPVRTTIFTNMGHVWTAATINSAINQCPSNQVVLLDTGTNDLGGTINIGFNQPGVTLRGKGTNTVFKNTSGNQYIHFGGNTSWANQTALVAGFTNLSTNITVTSSSGYSVGNLCRIWQKDLPQLVYDYLTLSNSMEETHVIKNVSGNVVTIWPPLAQHYYTNQSPVMETITGGHQVNFSGVEGVKLDWTGNSSVEGIVMEQVYGCWLSNITSYVANNFHVDVYNAANCTFRKLDLRDATTHVANSSGFRTGVSSQFTPGMCFCVIEDCIITKTFPNIEMNYGATGNIIGYNFLWDCFESGFGNGGCLMLNHGPHNSMNLAEGNVTGMIQSDGYFGSSSQNTLFRNWGIGGGPTYSNVNAICLHLNRWSYFYNVLDNVWGTNGMQTQYILTTSGLGYLPYIYAPGPPNAGNNDFTGTAPPGTWDIPGTGPTNPNNQFYDKVVTNTWTIHGNYDVVNNAIIYNPGIADHTFPNSYYLSSTPTWFGFLQWPPIDSSSVNYSRSMTNIPAGYRYVLGTDPPAGDPVITVQPTSQTVSVGSAATFSVTATTANAPLTYQWQTNGVNISGATSSSYTTPATICAQNGLLFDVIVKNSLNATVTSVTVTLNVTGCAATGVTYYVSTNGVSSNDGLTVGTPWPEYYALTNAGQSNILVFLPGIYTNIDLTSYAQQQGLTFRSQVKWGANIIGTNATLHAFDTQTAAGISNIVVDGFQISTSAIDGIKFNGIYSTAKNCWIYNCFGQGISAHNYNGTIIDSCLIEHCGTDIQHDHGIYVSGTNGIVRNNVLRYNRHYGLQIFDDTGDNVNWLVYNNLIYSNAIGMTIWSYAGYTNSIIGNTILDLTNDAISLHGGVAWITNNILYCGASFFPIDTNLGSEVVKTDYNLVSKSANPSGSHDVVNATAGFVNQPNGLFWITSGSPARGMQLSNIAAPVDFFSVAQGSVAGVGFVQYTAPLAADVRVLDPSPAAGADYWGSPQAGNPLSFRSFGISTLSKSTP